MNNIIPKPVLIKRSYNKDHEAPQECTCCGIVKQNEEFGFMKKYNIHRRQCRPCFNNIQRERYIQRKTKQKIDNAPTQEKARILADIKYLESLGVDLQTWLQT